MSLKDLYKNLGINNTIENEKRAFVNRSLTFLDSFLEKKLSYDRRKDFFIRICYQLGANGHDILNQYNSRSISFETVPDITKTFEYDYFTTLRVLVLVRQYFSYDTKNARIFDDEIENILNLCITDLGISYQSGMFFPKGEQLLDKELIGRALSILSNYPNEDTDLRTAIKNHTEDSKYGVIENCYRCIEGLLRSILNNNKTLIDNKADIIKRLGLSEHWKKILAQYIEYGNEYGRHASEKRHDFTATEVEAYLYTTCLLVRLIIKSI